MIEQDILDTLQKVKEFVEKCNSNNSVLCDLYGYGIDKEEGEEELEKLTVDLSDCINYLSNQWADAILMEQYRKAFIEIAKERNLKSKTDN